MKIKLTYCLLFLVFFQLNNEKVMAQPQTDWDKEKIIAKQFLRDPYLDGSSFIFDDWVNGTIALKSGEILEDVPVKYNGYHDELISYNDLYYITIQIEKETVHSFEYELLGNRNYFELRNFGDEDKLNLQYFQVYYEGDIDFVCRPIIKKINCSPYRDITGISRNEEFQNDFRFFFYTDEEGFFPVKLRRKSLFRYLQKDQKREVKRLLRQNNFDLKIHWDLLRQLNYLSNQK